MKPLTILFDADDTVENLLECWIALLNERYGTFVKVEDVIDWNVSLFFPTLSREQVYSVLNEDELFRRIERIPGSLEVLQRLYNDGHQLYMVTATGYQTCKAKMERIMELFPFLDWNHIIIASNKQMVKGDILIDDGPHNLLGGAYTPILFDQPHNRRFDNASKHVIRAHSWDEIEQLIRLQVHRLENMQKIGRSVQ